jgi:hypothetical protein
VEGVLVGLSLVLMTGASPAALRRHVVSPRRPGDPEEPTLSGGFTVRRYGGSHADGVDAIQLEIAALLPRNEAERHALIEQLAFAFGNLASRWAAPGLQRGAAADGAP